MSILKFLGIQEKPFPERGKYRGLEYRVDGDSVILHYRGRELEYIPFANISPDEYDSQKELAVKGKLKSIELSPWLAQSLRPEKKNEKTTAIVRSNATASAMTQEQNAAAYGMTSDEYELLRSIAGEILAQYWRSHSRKR